MRGSARVRVVVHPGSRFIPARAGIGPGRPKHGGLSTVHPRSCGDRASQLTLGDTFTGSSPLVRGSASCSGLGWALRRFIPARAGIGPWASTAGDVVAVHPRSCGDRARRVFPLDLSHWFIPARAGIGCYLAHRCRIPAVHPRSCGDRAPAQDFDSKSIGSSPLVRGSARRVKRGRVAFRFIPARAGIGQMLMFSQVFGTVHPRSCGDRMQARIDALYNIGSSPLVRGSVRRALGSWSSMRFIPARAGIGSYHQTVTLSMPVHPRSCGDRQHRAIPFIITAGSSPLVRGSDCRASSATSESRFIPARAGIGRAKWRHGQRVAVHPRSCGDRALSKLSSWPPNGSSPLVRGSADAAGGACRRWRFIPARAGIGALIAP